MVTTGSKEPTPLICPHFEANTCRSCGLLPQPYASQLAVKHRALSEALADLPLPGTIPPIVPSDIAFESRNKAKLAVSGNVSAPILGFPDSEGNVQPLWDCPLHLPLLNNIAARCAGLIRDLGIVPYNVRGRTGELKYLLLRMCEGTQQVMVRYVLRSTLFVEKLRLLSFRLQSEFPDITVCSVNLQPEPKAIVEGKREIILTEAVRVVDKLGEIYLCYSPQAFTQVTSNVAAKLYQSAASWIAPLRAESMLDLYCGVGAFALFCARTVTHVTGVEVSESAIADAEEGARLNRITNARFMTVDVSSYLARTTAKPDVLLVNPPRRGLNPEIVEQVIRVAPKVVVYSSCNPVSLRDDLRELSEHYRIAKVVGFDMFPLTEHLETLVLLER